MEKVVVAGCRPKPGFEREIEKLVRAHHSTLVPKGLATSCVPMILRGIDGTLVEIYEITDRYTKDNTNNNQYVMELWRLMDEACTYVPAGRLEDLQTLFSEMEVLS